MEWTRRRQLIGRVPCAGCRRGRARWQRSARLRRQAEVRSRREVKWRLLSELEAEELVDKKHQLDENRARSINEEILKVLLAQMEVQGERLRRKRRIRISLLHLNS